MIYLIIYMTIAFFMLAYVNRERTWAYWIINSLKYPLEVRKFKTNLKSYGETERLLTLVAWLDADFRFKKYWFGRALRKIVLKEIRKFE